MTAIGVAVGLVMLSRAMDVEFYISRTFPLIPLLNELVHQALEKTQTGRNKPIPPSRIKEEMKAGRRPRRSGLIGTMSM